MPLPQEVVTAAADVANLQQISAKLTIKDGVKWQDGKPVTCEDFKYTADQVQNGKNIYDQTGYVDLAKVDRYAKKRAADKLRQEIERQPFESKVQP